MWGARCNRGRNPFVSHKTSTAQIPENCTFTMGYVDGHRGLHPDDKLVTNLLDWNLPIA